MDQLQLPLSTTTLIQFNFLPPATKLGQGNIFRSVCQEFCSHPGAVHAGRYGQQAGGTHPTGMHTFYHFQAVFRKIYLNNRLAISLQNPGSATNLLIEIVLCLSCKSLFTTSSGVARNALSGGQFGTDKLASCRTYSFQVHLTQ